MACEHRAKFPGIGRMYLWTILYNSRRHYSGMDDLAPLMLPGSRQVCRACGRPLRFCRNARNYLLFVLPVLAAALLSFYLSPHYLLALFMDTATELYVYCAIGVQIFVTMPLIWYIGIIPLYIWGECKDDETRQKDADAQRNV